MKINLIIPSFYPAVIYGGPIFSTLYTCKELAKIKGIEVKVSTTNTNMTSKLKVKTNTWTKFDDNFYIKYYNETKIDKFSIQLYLDIWKDIRSADVIHIQSIFNTPTPISLLYAKVFKKPVVLSPRGSLGEWCIANGSNFKALWLRCLIKPFSQSVTWHATAEQEKQEILMLFPGAKVVIVPNGIDYDKFQNYNVLQTKEFINKYTGTDLDTNKLIISMGRLQKKKGFDILISAFHSVLRDVPDAMLFIAGPDEGEGSNLIKLINDLDLSEKVFLVGSIEGEDKVDFLANADLFVLPSHNENFGNVYLESLASGTPIVASINTPWQDVETYKCGKWVNNSIDDTSKAIIELLKEDDKDLVYNSKKLASKYSWKSIADSFSIIYINLLGEKI